MKKAAYKTAFILSSLYSNIPRDRDLCHFTTLERFYFRTYWIWMIKKQ